jgi:hypothetical protein
MDGFVGLLGVWFLIEANRRAYTAALGLPAPCRAALPFTAL